MFKPSHDMLGLIRTWGLSWLSGGNLRGQLRSLFYCVLFSSTEVLFELQEKPLSERLVAWLALNVAKHELIAFGKRFKDQEQLRIAKSLDDCPADNSRSQGSSSHKHFLWKQPNQSRILCQVKNSK